MADTRTWVASDVVENGLSRKPSPSGSFLGRFMPSDPQAAIDFEKPHTRFKRVGHAASESPRAAATPKIAT